MAATLFETEIAVANLRMLFAGNNSIGTLHEQRLDVASGFGDPDRFFLPCTFIKVFKVVFDHLKLNGLFRRDIAIDGIVQLRKFLFKPLKIRGARSKEVFAGFSKTLSSIT